MGPSKFNITTSEKYKFVWFRVAKVGTRTILGVLDKNPIVKATYFSNCRFPSKSYADYFKFAFVRDPASRFKSAWANKIYDSNYFNVPREMLEKLRDINYFIEMIHDQENSLSHVILNDKHFLLQSSLIDLNNVDFIGRMESFEKDMRTVLESVDLGELSICHKNKSSTSAGDLYSKISLSNHEKIKKICSKDLQIFGYN